MKYLIYFLVNGYKFGFFRLYFYIFDSELFMNFNFFLNSEVKILSKITGKTQNQIWLKEFQLTKKQDKIWQKKRQKLEQGIPLDYLLSPICLLNGLKLELDKNVLIPRPETEFWLEIMIKNWQQFKKQKFDKQENKENLDSELKPKSDLKKLQKSIKNQKENQALEEKLEKNPCKNWLTQKEILVEIGCGSGLICLSLSPYFERIIAIDKSVKALKIARKNAILNKIKNVKFIKADLLDFDLSFLCGKNWTLVANLPYLPIEDLTIALENKVNFEPKVALYSGENGLNCFEKLVKILNKIQKKKLKNKFQLKSQSSQKIENSQNLLASNSPKFWQNMELPSEIWLELDPRNIELAKKHINLKLEGFYQTQILKDYNNLERVLVCRKN